MAVLNINKAAEKGAKLIHEYRRFDIRASDVLQLSDDYPDKYDAIRQAYLIGVCKGARIERKRSERSNSIEGIQR